MEDTLSEVSKHCASEIRAFGACVDRNPEHWDTRCLPHRQMLTRCAETNVSSLRRVKETCTDAIAAYDACVNENAQTPEHCIEALKALHACTETAVGRALPTLPPTAAE